MRSFYIAHPRVSFDCGDEMMTKQSHKAECDIHTILRQYQRTGILTHVNNARPTWGELPDTVDYQEAMHTMMAAQEAFSSLPSKVRDKFSNDPAKFLAAFNDPAERDYLIEVGILKKPSSSPQPSPAPDPVTE